MDMPDFVALFDRRIQQDERPMHLTYLSLDARAVADLRLAEEELEEAENDQRLLHLRAIGQEQNADPDPRMAGKPDPLAPQRRRVADLIERVNKSTVLAVFRVPSADEQAVMNAASRASDMSPLEQARHLILESFSHFEWHGQRVDSLTSDHLAQLLPSFSQGETFGISTPLVELSGGLIELPKSVQAFVRKSAPDATPK